MGKIAKAMGFPSEGADDASLGEAPDAADESPAEDAADPGVGKAEVLAMKQFERSTTPEAKAQALKDFIQLCTGAGY